MYYCMGPIRKRGPIFCPPTGGGIDYKFQIQHLKHSDEKCNTNDQNAEYLQVQFYGDLYVPKFKIHNYSDLKYG